MAHVQRPQGSFEPELWIQYKALRARSLQVANNAQKKDARFITEAHHLFYGDLEHLGITIKGLPHTIKMVWGTGQVRCTWHLQDSNAHQVVRFLIRRAHSSFGEAMANRSIARIYYAENNSPISMDMLPAVPPNTTGYSQKGIMSPNSQPSSSSPSAQAPVSSSAPMPSDTVRAPSESSAAHILPPLSFSQDYIVAGHSRPIMRGIGSNVTVAPKMFLINRTAPKSYKAPIVFRTRSSHSTSSVLSLKPVPLMSSQLTTDVCVRLNDPADQSIISASPTVQFISFTTFLEDASPSHRYHCVVSDGKECMEVKLANKLGPLIERDVFVHTIAVIDGLERAEGGPVITSLRVVQKEAVKIGTPVSVEKLIMPAPTTPEDKKDTGVKDQSDQEELTKLRALLEQKQSSYQDVQRMLSEERAKRVDLQGLLEDEQTNHIKTQGLLKDERAKRISAESLLKDVQRESASPFVVPALAEALKMISELTDAAGMGGQIED